MADDISSKYLWDDNLFDLGNLPSALENSPYLLSLDLGLLITGFCWEFFRYWAERKRLDRKKVIVVEARGRESGARAHPSPV